MNDVYYVCKRKKRPRTSLPKFWKTILENYFGSLNDVNYVCKRQKRPKTSFSKFLRTILEDFNGSLPAPHLREEAGRQATRVTSKHTGDCQASTVSRPDQCEIVVGLDKRGRSLYQLFYLGSLFQSFGRTFFQFLIKTLFLGKQNTLIQNLRSEKR